MKIAIPTKSNNQIDAHFGHCEFFIIFTISENKEVLNQEKMESPQSCGCKSNLASDLSAVGVSIMLTGGIGEGAVKKLKKKRYRSNQKLPRRCE